MCAICIQNWAASFIFGSIGGMWIITVDIFFFSKNGDTWKTLYIRTTRDKIGQYYRLPQFINAQFIQLNAR